MPRFRMTEDGNLINLTTREEFVVEQVSLQSQNMVQFSLKGGKIVRARRSRIDESGYSLGPAAEKKLTSGAARKNAKGTRQQEVVPPPPPPPPAADGQLVTITKSELLELHAALQRGADLTLKKLVALIKE